MYTPVNPSFTTYKWGLRVIKIIKVCLRDGKCIRNPQTDQTANMRNLIWFVAGRNVLVKMIKMLMKSHNQWTQPTNGTKKEDA